MLSFRKTWFAPVALLTMIAAAAPTSAQHLEPDSTLHLRADCGGAFQLCGFIDTKAEALAIPRKFEKVFPFTEGLAAVKFEGAYGYIDTSGAFIIEPKFDLAGQFHNGLAEIIIGNQAGIVDRTGKLRITPQFARAVPVTDHIVIAHPGQWRSSYFEGAEKLPGVADALLFLGPNTGIYHIDDGWLVEPKYEIRVFDREGGDLLWAAPKTSRYDRNAKFGLLRSDGTWKIEPTFDLVQRLSEGFAIVSIQDDTRQQGTKRRSGAVNSAGDLVVPIEYDHLGYWSNGYGLVRQGDMHGLLDRKGQLVAGRFFDEVERGGADNLPRVLEDGIWKSVTDKGKLISDQREGEVILSCPSGLVAKRESNLIAFYAPSGERIGSTLFDQQYLSPKDCTSAIPVASNGKWGFITLDGRQIRTPLVFENTYYFNGSHTGVKVDGLWGVIDKTGAYTVVPKFEEMNFLGAMRYRVTLDGKTFDIDQFGNRIDAAPKPVKDTSRLLDCKGGGRLVTDGQNWGMVGPNEETLISTEHRVLACFKQGVSWAPNDELSAWCPIGPDGHFREDGKCKPTHVPYDITHARPETLSSDPYESSVLWFEAYLDYAAGNRDEAPRQRTDYGKFISGDISRYRDEVE